MLGVHEQAGASPASPTTARISRAEYLRDMQKMGVQFPPRRPILFGIIPTWDLTKTNF